MTDNATWNDETRAEMLAIGETISQQSASLLRFLMETQGLTPQEAVTLVPGALAAVYERVFTQDLDQPNPLHGFFQGLRLDEWMREYPLQRAPRTDQRGDA